jgi:hypothetical protein
MFAYQRHLIFVMIIAVALLTTSIMAIVHEVPLPFIGYS